MTKINPLSIKIDGLDLKLGNIEPFVQQQKNKELKLIEKDSGKKFGDIKVESKEFERKTGIPVSIQKQVIRRGMGAYLSSGSRATVSSPRQWGIARLYSFYFNKGKTFDKDLGEKVKFK